MAVLTCPGGHSFPDIEPYGWEIIAEERRHALVATIVDLARRGDMNNSDLYQNVDWCISNHSAQGYTCPDCGRLILFDNGVDRPAKSFTPEKVMPATGSSRDVS